MKIFGMEWWSTNAVGIAIAVLLCGVIALQFEQLSAIKRAGGSSFDPASLGTLEVHVANSEPIAVDATVRNPASSVPGLDVPLKVTTERF